MKSLSGLLPVLAIFLSLDLVRARPQANGQPISGVGIVEKVERVNLHEKVNSSGSNNRYFSLESYTIHNSTDSKCKVVLNRNFSNFSGSLEMKSFLNFILIDSAISEMLIIVNKSQVEKNTNIYRFFEIIDKYRISKAKLRLNSLFVIFKWYLRNCKALYRGKENVFRCTCGHFEKIDGSRKNTNQTKKKSCTFLMKFLNDTNTALVLKLNDEPRMCIILNLKLVAPLPSEKLKDFDRYRNLKNSSTSLNRPKRRAEPFDDSSREWIPISVSPKIKRIRYRSNFEAGRTHDDEIVQQFFKTSIPALKAPFIEKPLLPESLDELILLHTFHNGIIKKNFSVQINGNDEPTTYPPFYSTTEATLGIEGPLRFPPASTTETVLGIEGPLKYPPSYSTTEATEGVEPLRYPPSYSSTEVTEGVEPLRYPPSYSTTEATEGVEPLRYPPSYSTTEAIVGGEPLRYPPSYSTTLAAPGLVVNNAIEASTPYAPPYPYPSTSSTTAIYQPSYSYPAPTTPTNEHPLEWPLEQTKPGQNLGVAEVSPTFVEPVNVPVNFLPSTDDASPLNPITTFNGHPSPAILVIASPSDQTLEDIAGEVAADDALGGGAGGAAGGAGGGAAAAGAVAAGVAGAAVGAGALAAAGAAGIAAGAAAGAAAGVAAGAAAGVAAGAATGVALGAAAGGAAGGGGGGGGGGIGGNAAAGGIGGGGGGGGGGGATAVGGTAIDQTGAGAVLTTNVAAAGGDASDDMSLMDYVASIFGGMNILNPIGFTFWSMMFAPLSIILTSGLSMFAFLFPWLFPALWFGRSTAGHRSSSWYSHNSPEYYSDMELSLPYMFGYQRDTTHGSSIPINRKHVRKRRKRRAILVV